MSTAVLTFSLTVALTATALAASHVVQPGETLYSLAKQYGTTVQELVDANSIGSNFVIRVGQVLVIPAKPASQNEHHDVAPRPAASGSSTPAASGSSTALVVAAPSSKQASASTGVRPLAPTSDFVIPTTGGSTVGRPAVKKEGATAAGSRPVENQPVEPARPAEQVPETHGASVAQGTLTTPAAVIPVADGEVDLLARLVMAEAGNEPLEGQIGVAAVVVNRVRHQAFPKSITEVINEPGQFKSVELGRLEGLTPTASVSEAVRRALAGEDPTTGALFFYNPVKSTALAFWSTRPITKTIGNHNFAK